MDEVAARDGQAKGCPMALDCGPAGPMCRDFDRCTEVHAEQRAAYEDDLMEGMRMPWDDPR